MTDSGRGTSYGPPQDGLERRVAERTAELAHVNKALKQEVGVRRSAERKLVEHQSHLQDLAAEVVLAEERERRRIAERLHDDLGQLLALAQIRIGAVGHAADPTRQVEELGAIESLVEEAVSRTRSITCELSPPVLYELGLEAALQWLVEQNVKHLAVPAVRLGLPVFELILARLNQKRVCLLGKLGKAVPLQ